MSPIRRILIGVTALTLVVAGLLATSAGGAMPTTSTPVSATQSTTAVVIEDQEPPFLNPYLTGGGSLRITREIVSAVLPGAFRVLPDLTYQGALVNAFYVQTNPFRVTYQLRSEARWSDGVPVTADDLISTLEAIQDPDNSIASRTGYELITGATKLDSKTVRFVFSKPFHAWKSLFPHVLPSHVIAGNDLDKMFLTSIPVASGPFLFDSWQKGVQITLKRNETWWGPHKAYLERVVFRFIRDTNARFQALIAGEGTLAHGYPLLQVAELPAHGIVVTWIPGGGMEHLDANLTSPAMPLLAHAWFRQALAYGIDRDAIADALYGTLVSETGAHHSLVYPSNHARHTPHFDRYGYDPARVTQLMESHGCAKGGDGIWSCGGIRASMRFATTTGNQLRALAFEIMQKQWKSVGIEVSARFEPAGTLFGTTLPKGDFDLAMFTWMLDPDASGLGDKYGCDGAANYMHYCSSRVTQLLEAADTVMDGGLRAAIVNEADAIMADDVPSLPLFERPEFLAHWPELEGVVNNVGPQGIAWNIYEWKFAGATAPSISSFTPTSGPVGTIVTVYGTNLNGATAVKFNGVSAQYAVQSPTKVLALVPPGATTGKIAVTTPYGTAASAGDFTVTGAPSTAPTISALAPTSGPVGTIVVITGTNLTGATAVKFNGVSAPYLVQSSTKIYTRVPVGATTGKVSVTTPGGTATSASDFKVT